jgi:hypothetical protein
LWRNSQNAFLCRYGVEDEKRVYFSTPEDHWANVSLIEHPVVYGPIAYPTKFAVQMTCKMRREEKESDNKLILLTICQLESSCARLSSGL